MCNLGLGKAAVVPLDSKQAFSTRWCGCWLAVNDILETKSQHFILVLTFTTMGLFLQADKVFLVQVHSSELLQ